MNKKLVVKLIATVMAMTMVVGSGLTVFASAPGSAICDKKGEDPTDCSFESEPEATSESCKWTCSVHKTGEEGSYVYGTYTKNHEPGETETTCENCGRTIPASSSSSYDCSTQGHKWTEWKYAPSMGDEWKYCTECHTEVRRSAAVNTHSTTTSAPTAEQMHEEYAKAVEATVAAEVAAPVATFTSTAAVNAIPTEAKTTGAAYNLSSVTTTQGFVAAVNKIAKDTPATTMSVYSSKPIAMNSASIEAVTNSGKAFEYTFSYQGHIYKITIPAGAKINMNGQRFAGPLYIGAVLGTTQIIK